MSACATDGRCERGMFVWQRFPVVLCILAHTDEETARRAVPMILTMWSRDKRPPPWNDHYTYKLLRADSAVLGWNDGFWCWHSKMGIVFCFHPSSERRPFVQATNCLAAF